MSRHEFTLSAGYCIRIDGPRRFKFGAIERRVMARNPLSHYEACPLIRNILRGGYPSEEGARERLDTAERVIRFMDRTGLKPSRAWIRVFGKPIRPRGFDHTLVWHRDRRYIVTTEPYGTADDPTQWLTANGWSWLCLPEWGMWNPPATVLYVCSPPKQGIDPADMF